ncbi:MULTISPECIES: EF-hand domain-containing protein [Protofrankia]|uniref:EF-hand domain-containing protein n=1 Tax=Protofrankia coriariae TaxID=1562887 RepID=A0ABR5F1M1_9ACTN|nr:MULTISPECIES: EF-hand domain-containing protein [Protofrankia]KLL10615.1 hypothetical protein FrCorBMG51_16535 [Protofrankia coriariae]ONH35121.1 hypothetical protein BL254_13105 [Protofrankia sp. BMG5.30]
MAAVSCATNRLDQVFRTLDIDGDGFLEWSDLQRLVDRYLAVFSVNADSLPGRGLRAAYEMEWLHLRRQVGGRPRLAAEEFPAAVAAASADTSRFDLLENVPQAIFDLMDSDGDDAIDRTDFARFLEVWQIPAGTGQRAFTAMDRDADGLVSRHEFVTSVREFHSDGSDRPGDLYLE